jgi:hypothetical protein
MTRTVVKLSGMPFDPTYEIADDTIAIGDLIRVPGSGSGFIKDGEARTVIAHVGGHGQNVHGPSLNLHHEQGSDLMPWHQNLRVLSCIASRQEHQPVRTPRP